MKFGILSLNIYEKDNNTGSILQSWALQQVLQNNNINNVIVNYKPDVINKKNARYPILNLSLKDPYRFFKRLPIELLNFKSFVIRDNKFRKFIKNNYLISDYCDVNTIGNLDVDGYIVGSDIVWHDEFWNGLEPAYFCYADGMGEKYNISYAPSMRHNGFLKENELKLPEVLKNFNCISVREKSKVEYIKHFTDKNVECVLDPTFLLDVKEYNKITSNRLIKEKYVLVYCVSSDKELIKYAKKYADAHGYRLIEITCCSGRIHDLRNIKYNSYGIEEWLSLVKYSEMNFTTSFHCCIFSILFKKQFFAKYQEFGSTKIIDLLSQFNITNVGDKCPTELEIPKIEYKNVYKILNELKKNSLDYLLNAVNGNNTKLK